MTAKEMKKYADGIAFSWWHHFDKEFGTGIRWFNCKPGLFGVSFRESGLHLGLWITVRFELIAVHPNSFK